MIVTSKSQKPLSQIKSNLNGWIDTLLILREIQVFSSFLPSPRRQKADRTNRQVSKQIDIKVSIYSKKKKKKKGLLNNLL